MEAIGAVGGVLSTQDEAEVTRTPASMPSWGVASHHTSWSRSKCAPVSSVASISTPSTKNTTSRSIGSPSGSVGPSARQETVEASVSVTGSSRAEARLGRWLPSTTGSEPTSAPVVRPSSGSAQQATVSSRVAVPGASSGPVATCSPSTVQRVSSTTTSPSRSVAVAAQASSVVTSAEVGKTVGMAATGALLAATTGSERTGAPAACASRGVAVHRSSSPRAKSSGRSVAPTAGATVPAISHVKATRTSSPSGSEWVTTQVGRSARLGWAGTISTRSTEGGWLGAQAPIANAARIGTHPGTREAAVGGDVRIAMWSGPRNISTAMMRSFGNRADAFVTDEPLYAFYLRRTGIDHPMRAETLAAHEADWRVVVDWLTGPVPEGRPVWYVKHMTHHLLPDVDRGWIAGMRNAFLIRDPREMLLSYTVKRSEVTLEDLGLPQQLEIFERECECPRSSTPGTCWRIRGGR